MVLLLTTSQTIPKMIFFHVTHVLTTNGRPQTMFRCCSDNNVTKNRAAAASSATGKEENDSSNLEILPENDHDEFVPCKAFLGAKPGAFHRVGSWEGFASSNILLLLIMIPQEKNMV